MKIQQKNSRVEKEQKKEQPESVLEKTISVVFLIPFSKRYVYNEKREVNEMFETKEEAMRREWEIKQLSRKEKEKLIY